MGGGGQVGGGRAGAGWEGSGNFVMVEEVERARAKVWGRAEVDRDILSVCVCRYVCFYLLCVCKYVSIVCVCKYVCFDSKGSVQGYNSKNLTSTSAPTVSLITVLRPYLTSTREIRHSSSLTAAHT